ncbi:hypothetical protein [Citricoccus sp. GCM10030269]|uniref:hypothetical protein n=1 Tax=Citricoccus sp. GCM10030269 TaxID=3273388 RepID=UPI003613DE0F
MTDYWLDLDGCQAVIDDLYTILDTENTHFTGHDVDLDSMDVGLYASEETDLIQSSAESANQAINKFYDEELLPQYDAIITEIENCLSAMQDVVNYYVSGDAAMAAESSGREAQYPEMRSGGSEGDVDSSKPVPGDAENGAVQYAPESDSNTPSDYNVTPYTTAHTTEQSNDG